VPDVTSTPVRNAAVRGVSPARRVAAWLVTGPLGHLVAGVVDWAILVGRYAVARLRGRDPFAGS